MNIKLITTKERVSARKIPYRMKCPLQSPPTIYEQREKTISIYRIALAKMFNIIY